MSIPYAMRGAWLVAAVCGCVEPTEPLEGASPPGRPPGVTTRLQINGVDWNGVDWNGVDWNGVDWNGIEFEQVAWDELDWNGLDPSELALNAIDWPSDPGAAVPWDHVITAGRDRTTIPWNHIDWSGARADEIDWSALTGGLTTSDIDWNQVRLIGIWGQQGTTVEVDPDARPLFVFMRALYQGQEFPVAIPGPGSLGLIARAPTPAAAQYLVQRAWQISFGPGMYLLAGFEPPPEATGGGGSEGEGSGSGGNPYPVGGSGTHDPPPPVPLVAEGHFGMAPALAGLGPYIEVQARAWTSMVGNLLNDKPLEISLRAAVVGALAASAYEQQYFPALDIRAAIGNLIPPPWDPSAQPRVVLLRSRQHMMRDQLWLRGACPLEGARVRSCAGGQVWAVDLEQPGPDFGCTGVVTSGPHAGSVAGTCWVELPAQGLSIVQDASEIATVASFVAAGLPRPPEP